MTCHRLQTKLRQLYADDTYIFYQDKDFEKIEKVLN